MFSIYAIRIKNSNLIKPFTNLIIITKLISSLNFIKLSIIDYIDFGPCQRSKMVEIRIIVSIKLRYSN